ncbi:glutaminyl-peptide cyclotransferase [uncultured Sphingomonas sp.]|uniref:glutaminyl-peptide cyclotransferase n=1 Tax=uncultured Sphingomonas sp. TaxID=158754 RepID=UPI0035CB3803
MSPFLLALFLAPQAYSATAPLAPIPTVAAEIVREYPHDPQAYTEGLFYLDGYLYESTGEVGRSSIRKVDLTTGKVLRATIVPPPYYGEGIAAWGNEIVSLTWKDGVAFRWSLGAFRRLGRFRYPGEGWALTSDGDSLILSDGTATLRFLDPATFKVRRRLIVTANGRTVPMLNEVEYLDGEILANLWLTDRIARIDPANGHVTGWIDVSALHARAGNTAENDVANGIAWDKAKRRLFVTGKNWPYLFEIRLPPRAPVSTR